MASLNKVTIIGNLGKEPEIREMGGGRIVANVSVATSESWKDKSGQKQEKTEWHRVVFFDKTAEIARDYLRKGSKVYVEGKIETKKWTDKTGNDRYTTEIISNKIIMLDKKGDYDSNQDVKPKEPAYYLPEAVVEDNFDDDIPF